MRTWTSAAIVITGLALGSSVLVYALFPIDKRPSLVLQPETLEETESSSPEIKRPVSLVATEDFARRVANADSNVFERLPDGQIVRTGERPAERVAAENEDRTAERAFKDWEAVLSRYSRPLGGGVGTDDCARFSKSLNHLPSPARKECFRTALNVLTPENFSLVAALALDKSQSPEVIAEAFDACLNSTSEAAEQTIRKIAQDKSHPHYVDAARIMDIRRLGR